MLCIDKEKCVIIMYKTCNIYCVVLYLKIINFLRKKLEMVILNSISCFFILYSMLEISIVHTQNREQRHGLTSNGVRGTHFLKSWYSPSNVVIC